MENQTEEIVPHDSGGKQKQNDINFCCYTVCICHKLGRDWNWVSFVL